MGCFVFYLVFLFRSYLDNIFFFNLVFIFGYRVFIRIGEEILIGGLGIILFL